MEWGVVKWIAERASFLPFLSTLFSSFVSAQSCIHYNSTRTASAHPVPFYRINFHSGTAIILSGLFRWGGTSGSVSRNSFARGIRRNRVLSPCPVLFGYSVKPCFIHRFWMIKSCIQNVYRAMIERVTVFE